MEGQPPAVITRAQLEAIPIDDPAVARLLRAAELHNPSRKEKVLDRLRRLSLEAVGPFADFVSRHIGVQVDINGEPANYFSRVGGWFGRVAQEHLSRPYDTHLPRERRIAAVRRRVARDIENMTLGKPGQQDDVERKLGRNIDLSNQLQRLRALNEQTFDDSLAAFTIREQLFAFAARDPRLLNQLMEVDHHLFFEMSVSELCLLSVYDRVSHGEATPWADDAGRQLFVVADTYHAPMPTAEESLAEAQALTAQAAQLEWEIEEIADRLKTSKKAALRREASTRLHQRREAALKEAETAFYPVALALTMYTPTTRGELISIRKHLDHMMRSPSLQGQQKFYELLTQASPQAAQAFETVMRRGVFLQALSESVAVQQDLFDLDTNQNPDFIDLSYLYDQQSQCLRQADMYARLAHWQAAAGPSAAMALDIMANHEVDELSERFGEVGDLIQQMCQEGLLGRDVSGTEPSMRGRVQFRDLSHGHAKHFPQAIAHLVDHGLLLRVGHGAQTVETEWSPNMYVPSDYQLTPKGREFVDAIRARQILPGNVASWIVDEGLASWQELADKDVMHAFIFDEQLLTHRQNRPAEWMRRMGRAWRERKSMMAPDVQAALSMPLQPAQIDGPQTQVLAAAVENEELLTSRKVRRRKKSKKQIAQEHLHTLTQLEESAPENEAACPQLSALGTTDVIDVIELPTRVDTELSERP